MTKAARRAVSGTFASVPPGAAQSAIGRIVAYNDDAQFPITVSLVEGDTPTAARVASNLSARELDAAVSSAQPAIVVFESGDARLPIVVGLLAPRVEPQQELEIAAPDVGHRKVVEADVDGKRVRITGHDEIVFECGKASITLRRNGRIVVRGAYVETYATGTNRIKGGQVRIN